MHGQARTQGPCPIGGLPAFLPTRDSHHFTLFSSHSPIPFFPDAIPSISFFFVLHCTKKTKKILFLRFSLFNNFVFPPPPLTSSGKKTLSFNLYDFFFFRVKHFFLKRATRSKHWKVITANVFSIFEELKKSRKESQENPTEVWRI